MSETDPIPFSRLSMESEARNSSADLPEALTSPSSLLCDVFVGVCCSAFGLQGSGALQLVADGDCNDAAGTGESPTVDGHCGMFEPLA